MSKEQYVTQKMAEKGISGKPVGMANRTDGAGEHKFNAFNLIDRDTYGARGGDREHRTAPRERKDAEDRDAMKVDTPASSKKGEEIVLEFMEKKIQVYEREGQGWIRDEDVPTVRGATMKFEVEGLEVGGEIRFDEIKVRLTLLITLFALSSVAFVGY